jgi:hypothetical protein
VSDGFATSRHQRCGSGVEVVGLPAFSERPSGALLLTAARRYNRAMPYPRTHLAGLLASLAGVLLLLSEMAFAQRSGVRSGVIGNVPAHQRIAQQCDRWGLPWCPNWKSSP